MTFQNNFKHCWTYPWTCRNSWLPFEQVILLFSSILLRLSLRNLWKWIYSSHKLSNKITVRYEKKMGIAFFWNPSWNFSIYQWCSFFPSPRRSSISNVSDDDRGKEKISRHQVTRLNPYDYNDRLGWTLCRSITKQSLCQA